MATFVGIDIGARFVKLVVLKQKVKLHWSEAYFFPTPYLQNSKNLNAEELFRQLVSYVPTQVLSKAYIGVNIPSSLVTVMVVTLPKMSRKELSIAAAAEARRKMVPAPGPDSIFEYVILGEVIVGQIPRYEILVVKTEKTYIDETLRVFRMVEGITPFFISPTCYTIFNCFPAGSEITKKNTAFIDIGYDSIDISISKKGKLHFYRNVKFGMRDIIAHLSGSLSITPEEAEKVIREKGVPEVDVDLKDRVKIAEEIMRQKYEASMQEGISQEVNPLELRMLWQTEIERVVHEVRRTLIYYKDQSEGARVESVFFLGGGADIQGMVAALAKDVGGNARIFETVKETDLAVEVNNPQSSAVKGTMYAPALSIAVNMAAASKKEKDIDFLPLELKQQKQIVRKQLAAIFVAIGAASFLFLGWLNLFINNNVQKVDLESVLAEIKINKDAVDKLDALKNEQSRMDQKATKVGELMKARPDMQVILKGVADAVPDDVVLADITLAPLALDAAVAVPGAPKVAAQEKPNHVTIEAGCFTDYEGAVKLAQEFFDRLGEIKQLTNVRLSPPELEPMAAVVTKDGSVRITQIKNRYFQLQADLVKGAVK